MTTNVEKLEKIQTLTEIIGKHWAARGLDSNKNKENNAAIIHLDELFGEIVKNDAKFNINILKGSIKGPRDRLSYNLLHHITMSPLMNFESYKRLMGQEVHQYFMESSQQTNGFTDSKCLEHPIHATNLKNFITFKTISSNFILKELLTGWKPNYFTELQKDPKFLLNAAVNDSKDFRLFLKVVNEHYEKMLIQLRLTLDRSHIYVLPKKTTFTSDCPAYYLNLPYMNVPLEKIQRILPFEESHQQFLDKVIYCPISDTHVAVAVPYSLTFKPEFSGQYKHLIEGFIASDIADYIGLANSQTIIIPLLNLEDALHEIMRIIMTEPFDQFLMSRALSTLAVNNINLIVETLKENGELK